MSHASAPPLSGPRVLRLVSTSDVDEARLDFSRIYADSTIEPLPGLPFGCTLDVTSWGGLNFVAGSWPGGGRISIPVIGDRYIFTCSADGVFGVERAGEPFAVVPGQQGLLLSAAGPGASLHGGAGGQGRSITIERGALEAHFRALTGGELRDPIRFRPNLDLDTGPGTVVFEIAQLFRREMGRPGVSPLLLAALREALFTSLLTSTPHSASERFAPSPRRAAPGCVRRAEEYIEAHAAEPVTVADIARAVGVSVRSLQVTFKAYRDTTPMTRLRERRLDIARQRFLAAEPGTTVVTVVTALGFGTAGRFSILYKKRFGERPSETLEQARGPLPEDQDPGQQSGDGRTRKLY